MHEPEYMLVLCGDSGFEIEVQNVPIAKGKTEMADFLAVMTDVIENHASQMRFDGHAHLIESFAVDLKRKKIRIKARALESLEAQP